MKRRRLLVGLFVCFALYLSAFVVVHRSYTLRKPAANMAYWYYSDNDVVEAVEYYGFFPLRQIGYHTPFFMERHWRERIAWGSATGDMTPEEIERVCREVYGVTNNQTSK